MKLCRNPVKALTKAVFIGTVIMTAQASAIDLQNRPYEHVSGRAINDRLSYELGGGAAYGAASSRVDRATIGFGVKWKADMMCGDMNIQTSIKNQLNGVTDGFKNIMGEIVDSAQGAVASLPALVIQRANPGLYELLSNGVLQSRVDFDRAKLSCQGIIDRAGSVMDGGNIQSLAKAESMQQAIKDNQGDAVAAEKQVDDEGTENGVEWMGEKRGGSGQEPISLTRDIVRAAHNAVHGRSGTGGTSSSGNSPVTPAQCDGGAICTIWPTPKEAEEFAQKVVGETELTTCENGCDPARITPGTGLLHLADEVYEKKAEVMAAVMSPGHKITEEELKELSTPLLPVSRRVVEAMRDDQDAAMLAERMTSEIALADMIWKGIQLTRLLMAGQQNPDVQKLAEAKEHVGSKIMTLQAEIDSMKLELDLRRELANNTAKMVLEREIAGRAAASGIDTHSDPIPNRVEEAAKGAQ